MMQQVFTTWAAGGGLLWPLGLVSLLIFTFIFRTEFSVVPLLKSTDRLWVGMEACGGNTQRMKAFLQTQSDGLGQAYAKVLAGQGDVMQAWEEMELRILSAQSRDLLLLAAFTAAAPLLGLLGTVMGMIETFQATASMDGDTGKQIADGISSALITTQFGLVIALPGVFGAAHIRKRLRDLETRLTQCRFLLMEAFRI